MVYVYASIVGHGFDYCDTCIYMQIPMTSGSKEKEREYRN